MKHTPPRLGTLVPLVGMLLLSACAGRGMRIPGPTGHVGKSAGTDYDERLANSRSAAREREAAEAAPSSESRSSRGRRGDGNKVARAAGDLVGNRSMTADGERYRFDCSGFVEAAYARAGLHYSGSSKDLYAKARAEGVLHRRKNPHVGDVVFFDNTHDRNHNGRRDDELTHVAVVERVLDDGTVGLIHLGSKGVVRIAMNLHHPHDRHNDKGEIINSYVRGGRSGERLTGELFKAFGSLWAVSERDAMATLCTLQDGEDA